MIPTLELTIESPWLSSSSGIATLVIPPGSQQSCPIARLTSQSDAPLSGLELTTTFGSLPPGVNLSVALEGGTLPPKGSMLLTLQAAIPPSLAFSAGVSLIVRSAEGAAIQAVARIQAASTQLQLNPASVQVGLHPQGLLQDALGMDPAVMQWSRPALPCPLRSDASNTPCL